MSEKTWYLHYDNKNLPSGFSRDAPDDTAFIKITDAEKLEIERDPLRFIVLDGALCRVMMKRDANADYSRQRMAKAPVFEQWYLATNMQSILLALTGFNTGKEFYIRIITERGEKTVLVPVSKRQRLMDVYHSWLANNNLRET